MRRYTDSDERRIRARAQVREWADAGLIDASQAARLETDLSVDLRRTNVFLRVTLGFFTALIVASAVGFIWEVFHVHNAVPLAILAGVSGIICMALSEILVGAFGLYRFGVEEMLAACGVLLLSVSMSQFVDAWYVRSSYVFPFDRELVAGLAVAAAGGFGIYRRFGFVWSALGSVCCAAALPFQFSDLPVSARRAIAAVFLGAVFAAARVKRLRHGEEWPGDEYGDLQAAAFAGIYLVINLRLVEVIDIFSRVHLKDWFYWSTWILTWVLPVVGLVLSLREKDRRLLTVSLAMSILTLITNKPYLEWTRHTWDPMLLGALLVGVALALRRWLSSGPDGSRHGFVATQILRGVDPVLTVLSSAPVQPHPHAPTQAPPPSFDGGRSGGAGAGGSF
jgi:hypothetical protein